MSVDGDAVYRSLMDLDLVLQDGDKMVVLKMFLGSIDPSNPSLAKLHAEILAFTGRIEKLVAAAQKPPPPCTCSPVLPGGGWDFCPRHG